MKNRIDSTGNSTISERGISGVTVVVSGAFRDVRAARLPLQHYFAAVCFSSQSFWKAGSERKGSQIGSSLRRAGVIGTGGP